MLTNMYNKLYLNTLIKINVFKIKRSSIEELRQDRQRNSIKTNTIPKVNKGIMNMILLGCKINSNINIYTYKRYVHIYQYPLKVK